MKRPILFVFALFVAAFMFGITATANGFSVSDVLEESGANGLYDNETGITPDNMTEKISFSSVFEYISDIALKAVKDEFNTLGVISAITVAASIFNMLGGSYFSRGIESTVNTAATVSVLLFVSSKLSESCINADVAINCISDFSKLLMPVSTALLAASGQAGGAVLSEAVLIAAAEIIVFISSKVIMPAINLYFALCVSKALCTAVDLSGVCEFFKKSVLAVIAVMLTVFTAVMSFQGVIAMTGDSVAKSGIKTAIINIIPAIGGQIGETVDTFLACATSAKTLTGVFGVVIIASITLAPTLSVLVRYAIMRLCAYFSDICGNNRISGCLKDVAGGFSMIIALTAGTAACLVTCITVLMIVWRG
ncbi:MAG: hypothetical protein IKA51_01105 [Clostridia bacterium]|nr:hypothetical protein [Clostridia bacterium]